MSTFPILAVLASVVCVLGCWCCCRQPGDLDQAALLPFADDPEAAAANALSRRHPKCSTQRHWTASMPERALRIEIKAVAYAPCRR
ncbi:hypothetical protein FQZ97_1049210 [compost metagenome]